MTNTWQRQAVGLAAGACLLTGVSAAQAAPTGGLIDLGSITIANGESQQVDFDSDGTFDFTFANNDGIISFSGNSVFGTFTNGEGSGQRHNTLATNGGGGAVGIGPGRTITGTPSIFFGEGGAEELFDEFTVDEGGEGGTTFAGEQNGTIDPNDIDDDEFLVGQFYQPNQESDAVTAPMFFLDIDITEGQDGTTLTLTGAFEDGDVITTPRVAALPEPGAAMLLLGGLIGLGAYRSRKRS